MRWSRSSAVMRRAVLAISSTGRSPIRAMMAPPAAASPTPTGIRITSVSRYRRSAPRGRSSDMPTWTIWATRSPRMIGHGEQRAARRSPSPSPSRTCAGRAVAFRRASGRERLERPGAAVARQAGLRVALGIAGTGRTCRRAGRRAARAAARRCPRSALGAERLASPSTWPTVKSDASTSWHQAPRERGVSDRAREDEDDEQDGAVPEGEARADRSGATPASGPRRAWCSPSPRTVWSSRRSPSPSILRRR